MGSRGASDDVAVPFGRIQEISAKYNLTVGLGPGGRALGKDQGIWPALGFRGTLLFIYTLFDAALDTVYVQCTPPTSPCPLHVRCRGRIS